LTWRNDLVVQSLEDQQIGCDLLGKVNGRPIVVVLRNLGESAADWDEERTNEKRKVSSSEVEERRRRGNTNQV